MDIWIQYLTASAYHQRFYGGPPPAHAIRRGVELIAEFIQNPRIPAATQPGPLTAARNQSDIRIDDDLRRRH